MSRETRVCPAQMEKLLDLLSQDGVLLDGKIRYTTTYNKQHVWKRIATQLNSVPGGGSKNCWKWCKMWIDWKTKTKKKANILLRRKHYNLEDDPNPRLSALERRLLRLINYPLDDKSDAPALEMTPKVEAIDNTDGFHIEFLIDDSELQNNKISQDEDRASDCFVTNNESNEPKLCDVNDISQEEEENETIEESDNIVKLKEKQLKKKKYSLEEYKIRTTLQLEKDRVEQKNEELRLRAIELKLKGEEIRLKEMEMNKINYLTNIEEEKLKCFRDISSSLKELLERTRSGNFRFHNSL